VSAVLLVLALAVVLGAALHRYGSPPTLQEEMMSIAADVRCPVCQGESVADSDAAASLQIQQQILTDLQQGQSRAQILRAIAAEYGSWILYRPPVRGWYLLLWGLPALAVAAGLAVLVRALRHRAGSSAEADEGERSEPFAARGTEELGGLPPELRRYL